MEKIPGILWRFACKSMPFFRRNLLPAKTYPASDLPRERFRLRVPAWSLGLAVLAAASVGLHLFAIIIHRLGAEPRYRDAILRAGQALADPDSRNIGEVVGLAVGLAFACFIPLSLPAGVRRAQEAFRRLSWRRRESILLAALVPVALRLSLFPVVPVPAPKVADEFGHLLVAHTFASGRITNPPHKLWPHFETLYVLQQPTYASIYPFAQGLVMAVPSAIGVDPWFGVCASVGAMCAALCWMLQGWLPPPWALLGALLAGVRLGIHSYWMNSYWGGAVAAIGGALLLGALPRALRRKQASAAFLMGIGLAILAQSRPLEGLLLFLPVGAAIAIAFVREKSGARRAFVVRVLLPLACSGAVIVAGTLYYNRRVTGNALLFPYQLHQKNYGTPQNLRGGREVVDAPRAHVQKDIADSFEWQRDMFREQATWRGLAAMVGEKLRSFWSFYLGPGLTIPLLVFGLAGRRIRLLAFAALFVVIGVAVLYPFFFPHYVAPVFGATLAATMYGMRRIRLLRWHQRQVGRRWIPWVVASSAAGAVASAAGWTILVCATSLESTPRSGIEAELKQRGGSHLVLVRYGAHHSFHKSWIYNAADVDRAPVVWARDMGDAANKELLQFFKAREAWLAEVDEEPPLLTPYFDKDRPRVIAVLNAAGKSPYFKGGITPGSIVTILGRNLARGVAGTSTTDLFLAAPSSGTLFPAMKRFPFLAAPKPLNLAQTRVKFGETPAPVLAASNLDKSESVTVQTPFHLPGNTVTLTVASGEEETVLELPILPANPGIFQVPASDGELSGALLRPDDSVVSATNPARRGETIRMLVTGLGPDPLGPLIVGVNNRGAPVRWTKRGPPSVGVDIVAFDVPPEAPSGPRVPLSMAVVVDGKPVYSNDSKIAIE